MTFRKSICSLITATLLATGLTGCKEYYDYRFVIDNKIVLYDESIAGIKLKVLDNETAITYYYPYPTFYQVTKIVKERGKDKKTYDRNSRVNELLFIEADRQFSNYISRINRIIKNSVLE